MEITAFLEQNPSLKRAAEYFPDELVQKSRPVHFPKGQWVVRRNDPVRYAYFILKGEICVISDNSEGKEVTWMLLQVPYMISDLELLAERKVYACNVLARTDCIALAVDAGLAAGLLHRDIDFLWKTSSQLADINFANTYGRGYAVACSSMEKVMIYLLQQCSAHDPCVDPIVLRKTRAVIASEIAISTKTLERSVNQLKEKKLITIRNGKIQISKKQRELLR